MSKGPTGTKEFTGNSYYNLELNSKDWCTYFKKCLIENNISETYCHVCKYQKKLDITTLLAERGKGRI